MLIENRLTQYLKDTLGIDIQVEPLSKDKLGRIPYYISESYRLYDATLFGHPVTLAERRENDPPRIEQTQSMVALLKNAFGKEVALVLGELPAYERKRLIERQIAFIVPGRQLFLPAFLIDIHERAQPKYPRKNNQSLLPSAQSLIIHHILHRYSNWKLEGQSLKNIAEHLGYTPMGITKAVENLKHLDLIDVATGKEKAIHFRLQRAELWRTLVKEELLIDPVLKRIFSDARPEGVYMLSSNVSALSEYTDLNPTRDHYYAIGKRQFYAQKGKIKLVNANEQDGPYCVEVWKYDPMPLADGLASDAAVVDPLSLYLSLKNLHDERVELALEQIETKYIW